jgi:hypothetical protein
MSVCWYVLYIEVEKSEKILKFLVLKGRKGDGTYIYESRVAPLKPPKRVIYCLLIKKFFFIILYCVILAKNFLSLLKKIDRDRQYYIISPFMIVTWNHFCISNFNNYAKIVPEAYINYIVLLYLTILNCHILK